LTNRTFLSLFCTGQPEIWFHLGIAAQKCDKIDLALRAYALTLELDPKHIGARLLAAECLVNCHLNEEANKEIAEAKKIIKEQTVDQVWLDLLSSLENTYAS
jgi:cytochrome c-type biogenesis protein CcmH/NrfG